MGGREVKGSHTDGGEEEGGLVAAACEDGKARPREGCPREECGRAVGCRAHSLCLLAPRLGSLRDQVEDVLDSQSRVVTEKREA